MRRLNDQREGYRRCHPQLMAYRSLTQTERRICLVVPERTNREKGVVLIGALCIVVLQALRPF
jgi:hypothetical protein